MHCDTLMDQQSQIWMVDALLMQRVQGAFHDPTVDDRHEAAMLCDGKELAGCQELTVGCAQSQLHLVVQPRGLPPGRW